jgi:hypothetical protein
MEEFKAIEFQHARDFSRKLNATFEFIRQNFKPLGKSILFIAGPPVLVGSVIGGSFMGEFLNMGQSAQSSPDAFSNYFLSISFWIQMMLMFVFLTVSFVIAIATINTYLIIYDQKKTNQIEVSEVWDGVRNAFWSYLGTSVLFFVLFITAYLVLLIPIFILADTSVVLVIFGALFVIGAIIFLLISSSLTYFIQLYEKKNFVDAVGRSMRLVNNGKWWSTFGLIMVLYLIMMTVSYIFIIPYYAVLFTNTLHSVSTGTAVEPSASWKIWTIVFFTLYYMAQMIMYALPNVGIAFQYFNLVELKEAKGLMTQIENLGQSSTTGNRPEEHY